MRSDQRNGSSGVDGVKATFHFSGAPSGFSRLDEETPGASAGTASTLGGLARGGEIGANCLVPRACRRTPQPPHLVVYTPISV